MPDIPRPHRKMRIASTPDRAIRRRSFIPMAEAAPKSWAWTPARTATVIPQQTWEQRMGACRVLSKDAASARTPIRVVGVPELFNHRMRTSLSSCPRFIYMTCVRGPWNKACDFSRARVPRERHRCILSSMRNQVVAGAFSAARSISLELSKPRSHAALNILSRPGSSSLSVLASGYQLCTDCRSTPEEAADLRPTEFCPTGSTVSSSIAPIARSPPVAHGPSCCV